MANEFKDTMGQVFREAPPEMVEGFRRKMQFIQAQYKHSKTTVQSCLDGMADPPSLLELITAAYVINGGLLFKHGDDEDEESGMPVTGRKVESEEESYDRLIREMDELNCAPPPESSSTTASTAQHKTKGLDKPVTKTTTPKKPCSGALKSDEDTILLSIQ